MACRIITPTSALAQSAYEFATMNSRQTFAAVTDLLKQLNITLPHGFDDALTSALVDVEEVAFYSGFAMCDALRNVPMIAGGD